jgi:hypothetical protein
MIRAGDFARWVSITWQQARECAATPITGHWETGVTSQFRFCACADGALIEEGYRGEVLLLSG